MFPVERIERVIAAVATRPLTRSHAAVPGWIDCAGEPVPVVDLCQLRLGRSCAAHYSTRILLLHSGGRRFGVQVEQALNTLRVDPASISQAGPERVVTLDGANYELVDIETLLPAELMAYLAAEGV